MVLQWSPVRILGWRLPLARLRRHLEDRGNVEELAPLLRAIQNREIDGDVTTFRELHKITALSQTRALNMVRELEDRGLLRIERKPHDRLASVVRLTDKAMRLLSISRDAA